VVHIQTQ